MKRTFILQIVLTLFVLTCVLNSTNAQTDSKGFSFQSYAVDGEGKAIGNTSINVRFTIYPVGGSAEYEEVHTLNTDAYGVFNATIGSITPNEFQKLNFNLKNYKLKAEVKRTTEGVYTVISDAVFQAVPYARNAANGVPVGTVISFAGPASNIPDGWLICDGSLVNRNTYPQLYNAIGFAWGGSGDNFNIPDLRGMFLRGVAGGSGYDPDRNSRTALKSGGNTGDNVGSLQGNTFGSHTHTFNGNTGTTSTTGHHNHGDGDYDNLVNWDGYHTADGVDHPGPNSGSTEINLSFYGTLQATGNHNHSFTPSGSNSATGGNETRPTNVYVYYIIKY